MSLCRPVLLLLMAVAWAVPAPAQVLEVGPQAPHPTLAAAIAAAVPGDTLRVLPGTYSEGTLVIDKSITLEGVGRPVLDGGGTHQILTITAPNVTVRGFALQNVGTSFVEDRAAIKVDGGHGCVIEDNRFTATFFGIYLSKVDGCRVSGNRMVGLETTASRSANGIHVWYSKNVLIEQNTISGHRDGVYLEFVEDSRVVGNQSRHNSRYGLHFMFSDRCAYVDNVFEKNGAGVAVMYTEEVEMHGNHFADNWGPASFGLLLKDINDSRITDNTFTHNTIGLYAEGANRMEVRNNQFVENGWAVKIMANATENTFARNNFIGNTFDVATNSRQHYSTFTDNYWDQYEGYDLDRDGHGDVPFRPVRLFSFLVERNKPAVILTRSLFVSVLDAAERILPVLTPETLIDLRPRMQRIP